MSAPVPWVSVRRLSLTRRTAARLSAASQSNGVMSPMTVRWNRLWIGNDGVWRCWKHWLCLIGGYNAVLEHSSLCLSVRALPAQYLLSKIYCTTQHACVETVFLHTLHIESYSDPWCWVMVYTYRVPSHMNAVHAAGLIIGRCTAGETATMTLYIQGRWSPDTD